jgi:hypothetical protein
MYNLRNHIKQIKETSFFLENLRDEEEIRNCANRREEIRDERRYYPI